MDQHEVAERRVDLGVASDSQLITLESGPKFHVRERVLAVDPQQSGDAVVAGGSGRPMPPLYEATVLKSGMRRVDPTSGVVVHPEHKTKGIFRHHPPHRRKDLGGEGDCGVGGDGEGAREWCHLIHFQGWNARHDCWMREANLFHDTPENRTRVGAKVAAKQKEGGDEKKKSRRRGEVVKERKSADDDALIGDARSSYDKNLQLITMACALPFTLQTVLVDEGENITKRVYPPPIFNSIDNWTEKQHRGILMLHVIPAKRNIIDVIGEYVQYVRRRDFEVFANEPKRQRVEEERRKASAAADTTKKNHDEAATSKDDHLNKDDRQPSRHSKKSTKAFLKLKRKRLKQFAAALIALFDVSLPQFLLYKEEREQYEKFVHGEGDCDRPDTDGNTSTFQTTDTCGRESAHKRPSELYGAEHLLRFLVKLPFILSLYDCRDANNSRRSLGISEEEIPKDVFILESEELSRDLANHLSNLVIFLQKNPDLFTREYIVTEKDP